MLFEIQARVRGQAEAEAEVSVNDTHSQRTGHLTGPRGDKETLYIDEGLKEADAQVALACYAHDHPVIYFQLLREGPYTRYRWVAWKVAMKLAEFRQPGLYETLKRQKHSSTWLETIKKDLDRTFPLHPLFGSARYAKRGQESLENLLAAYALYNPYVGYCQGMNFVAGFLLILSGYREEEAFWMFAAITKTEMPNEQLGVCGVEGLYTDGFPLLRVFLRLFEVILGTCEPQASAHFQNIGLPSDLWLLKWISTIFLYSLPMGHCIRFWDYLLARGTGGLLRIALAIVQSLKAKLITYDFSECNDLLRDIKEGCGLPSPDEVLKRAEALVLDWPQLLQQRRQISIEIEHENSDRQKKKVEEEEAKKRILESLAQAQAQTQPHLGAEEQKRVEWKDETKVEEIESEDEQRGRGEMGEALPKMKKRQLPSPIRLTYRRGREGEGLRKEESIKLPPIQEHERQHFVFECNSEILSCPDEKKENEEQAECLSNQSYSDNNDPDLHCRLSRLSHSSRPSPNRLPRHARLQLMSMAPRTATENAQGEERKQEEEQTSRLDKEVSKQDKDSLQLSKESLRLDKEGSRVDKESSPPELSSLQPGKENIEEDSVVLKPCVALAKDPSKKEFHTDREREREHHRQDSSLSEVCQSLNSIPERGGAKAIHI